jgi:single-stranded-DNA-specific exonuclease
MSGEKMTYVTDGFCADVSVRGKKWQARKLESVAGPAGIHPVISSLVAARGYDPETFFSPSLKTEMPNPSSLKGMDDAAKAFCDAVIAGKRMVLYGDYDVDGATSTSLVLRWLRAMGADAAFYIPDRMKEGYGPNADAIRKLHADEGIEFILFLDSGTTAHIPLGVAAELGMEIVIIDHHEPDDRDPPGILVNPKRRDEDRSLAHLCTAGLAFLFLVAVQREMRAREFFTAERPAIDLRDWLGIVALGTVADVVPLSGLNRAYVAAGLKRMQDVPGIAALAMAAGEENFTAQSCGFVFGPCINASGRIGDTRLGTTLLATDDAAGSSEIAKQLVEVNRERQDLQKSIMEGAIETAKSMADDPVIVLSGPDWHPGVVGIVAARIKDIMDRPAVIIGAGGTASCRAVEGFDIGSAVIAAREAGILIKGGGHAAAAGLTVAPERVDELRAFLAEKAKGFVAPPVTVDMVFRCGELTPEIVAEMERMQPFGVGNSRPKVAIVGGWVRQSRTMKETHVKIVLSGHSGQTEAVMWKSVGTPVGDALVGSENTYVDVIGTPKIDEYGGRRRVVITVDDVMVGSSRSDDA